MSLPLYPDGCIIPNIRTYPYLLIWQPDCEHGKIRGAAIGIYAIDDADARAWAADMGRFPKCHLAEVRRISEASASKFAAFAISAV